MVKDAHKHRHRYDPTLAKHIHNKINIHPLSSILTQYLKLETKQFLNLLKTLDERQRGNEIASLLVLTQKFQASCELAKIPAGEQKTVNSVLSDVVKDLKDLHLNMRSYQVSISSALDGYTLNRTTYLIETIQALIQEQRPSSSLKSFLTHSINPEKVTKSIFSSGQKVGCKVAQKDINFIQEIKECFEKIRSQVGSPEMMPKGLAIHFMFNLCETSSNLLKNDDHQQNSINQKIVDFIQFEINQLRHYYPEVAQAGEELQKAIANCQHKKP